MYEHNDSMLFVLKVKLSYYDTRIVLHVRQHNIPELLKICIKVKRIHIRVQYIRLYLVIKYNV